MHALTYNPNTYPQHTKMTLQADGSPVGIPPSLSDVSPQAQQLVGLVAAVQAETFTYARCVKKVLARCWRVLGAWGLTALWWCLHLTSERHRQGHVLALIYAPAITTRHQSPHPIP